MRFSPLSEQEAMEANKPGYLLRPGEADFEVKTASLHEKTYDNGTVSESIKLVLEVYDADGKQASVYDYLSASGRMAFKLRQASYAAGIGHLYERGDVEPDMFIGKSGRCLIRNAPPKNGYEAKNEIAGYVVADSTKSTSNYETSKAGGPGQVAVDRERTKARTRFNDTHPDLAGPDQEGGWQKACRGHFGATRNRAEITAEEWKSFGETFTAPVEDETIPF